MRSSNVFRDVTSLAHVARTSWRCATLALAASLVGCSDTPPPGGGASAGAGQANAAGASSGAGVSAGGASLGAGGVPTAGVGGVPGAAGTLPGSAGSGVGGAAGSTGFGAGGAPPTAGLGGASGVSGTLGGSAGEAPITAGNGGAAGGAVAHRDHCAEGYDAEPSDATMVDGPAEYTESSQIDLTVQPAVLTWMGAHQWEAAHFEWHSIRRCNGGGSQSRINVCSQKEMIPNDQECKSDGDGLQFFAMHRHMIQSLKQLWPNHTEQFEGFEKFPQSANDVPEQWRAAWSAFSSTELANAKIADEIDKPENLSKFATEGAFGRWLQCQAPSYSGLHGALHFKWVRTQNSTHGLGNQFTNIDNYMFWKLHGWIDKVWDKYRAAKGLTPDDPALKDQLKAQCYEMDKLASLIDPNLPANPADPPLPRETGVFHTDVRPMFENEATTKCSGCHGVDGAEVGMTLGGHKSSTDIVAGLVNVPSQHGGQFMRVLPGDPEHSWLYLKASGTAASAGCVESATAECQTGAMPPTGAFKPTAAELQKLYDWIKSGAPAPTILPE